MLDNQSGFTIRPSGTEPKVKIYFSVVGESFSKAREELEEFQREVLALIEI